NMLQLTLVLMLAGSLTKAFPASMLRYPYYTEVLNVLRDLSSSSTEGPSIDKLPDLLANDIDNVQVRAELPRGLWWWYRDMTHPQIKRRQNIEGRSLYNHNSFGLRYGK
uniref:Kisspeptin 1 n=1 Tax=Esox lucius TaxID=8010 RepID=A0A3P8ZFB3_ESOLU